MLSDALDFAENAQCNLNNFKKFAGSFTSVNPFLLLVEEQLNNCIKILITEMEKDD